MDILKKIALCSCIFLVGCEGGFINSGVGQSGEFVSLVERMNTDIRFQQSYVLMLENSTEYVDFRITGIESIDHLQTNEALVLIPKYNLETRFNRTEIIRYQIAFTDNQGNLNTRMVTALFGTEDKYYSESDFPLDKLLVVSKLPSFEDSSELFSQGIYISYFHNNITFNGIEYDDFIRNGAVLSYYFERTLFDVRQGFQNILGTAYGSGKISAEKEGEFPRF